MLTIRDALQLALDTTILDIEMKYIPDRLGLEFDASLMQKNDLHLLTRTAVL